MIGTTLREIRAHLEQLASEDGEYYLQCARTGDRPVPAADLRFQSRLSARAAAVAVEQYRATLRRYDPRVPYYDVVACEAEEEPPSDAVASERATPEKRASAGEPADAEATVDPALGDGPFDVPPSGRSGLVECCHRVAAAVFEALSEAGHDAVESAVLDAYVELAETVTDPDELCCRLLESMASEIDRNLDPGEQAAVVADAAARSPAPAPADRPIGAAIRRLEERGMFEGHDGSATAIDRDVPTDRDAATADRTVSLTVSGYALTARDGRLPVLPIAVELCRQLPDREPAALEVVDVGDGWRFELTLAEDAPPRGLASAPIHTEA